MKRVIAIAIIAVVAYFGYQFYQRQQLTKLSYPVEVNNEIPAEVVGPAAKAADFLNVLGAATGSFIAKSTDFLNNATDGQAEPVINKAVSDLQNRVKDLPREEYQKVKAEFCKDVLPSPSPSVEATQ